MTDNNTEKLITMFSSFWTENYVVNVSEQVKELNLERNVYKIAVCGETDLLPKKERDAVLFRSAYVLEYILRNDKSLLEELRESIYKDFPTISNESAKRHFCSIMTLLLQDGYPSVDQSNLIAGACMEWIEKPGTKVAVLVNAMEVIFMLRAKVSCIEEIMPDLIALLRRNPTPGILSRIRKWKKIYGDI